jgi:hypothetical protein
MKKTLLILLWIPMIGLSQSTTLLDSMLHFYNDHNNGTQKLQSKSVFEYNANNLITNKEEYTYYFNNLMLAYGTKTSYTYDSNNNIDIQIVRILDSIACINYMMTDDDYDLNANKIQSVVSYWDNSLSIFINSSKTECIYDINNNLTLKITYSWDTTLSIWVDSWKREYAYNSNGFITFTAQYLWNNGWEGHWKNEYEYDLNNNLSKDSRYWWGWDGITYTWTPNTKYEYSYDNNNNNILSKTGFIPSSPSASGISFQLFQKDVYSYNTNNQQIEQINSFWDSTTQSWVNSSKTESEYINSQINERISYSWDSISSIWNSTYKTEYLYNVNGVSITSISSSWLSVSSNWVYSNKTEEINDVSGNSLLNTSFQWDTISNMWISSWEVTGTYENSYLCEDTYVVGEMSLCEYIMQSCGIISIFNNNPISNIFYDYSSNMSDSTIFFYSYIASSIDDINTENQTNKRNLISITDVLGRETKDKKNTPLFYIYDDGTVEKKIIIE